MVVDLQIPPFHEMRSQISVLVTPIQYLVSLPIDFVNWIFTDVSTRQQLLQENAQLKASLLLFQAELQKQYAIESENQQLRTLLGTSQKFKHKVSAAQLLAVVSNPFSREVVLNKGSMDGVFVGQPIMDAWGIMGQVVQVNAATSRVMLLTDARSSIPVQVKRNNIRAIATGDPRFDVLRLEHILNTEDIQKDDFLVTSGLGGRYPYGYPVGEVISVKRDSNAQFAEVVVKPSAHLRRSRLVLLLWKQEGKS